MVKSLCVAIFWIESKASLYKKKQLLKKVEKLHFFQGGRSMAWVKSLKFFHHFILGNIKKEIVLHDILDSRKAFLDN